MAEVNHAYAEQNTLQSTTSASSRIVAHEVLGSSLTGNTRYLIIARALVGHSSATTRGEFTVIGAGGGEVLNKSLTEIEFQQTGSTNLKSWMFVYPYTTANSPADIGIYFRSQGGSGTVYADQLSLMLIDLDDLSGDDLLGVFRFDASDAGPTDSSANWTDDANAFDASYTSFARSTSATGNLSGEGTTAPTTGDAIGDVYFRVLCEIFSPSTANVYEDSVGGTLLGTVSMGGAVPEWREIKLTPPSGGWTWQKVNDLAVEFDPGSGSTDVYMAEVKVYSTTPVWIEDIQDASATELSTTQYGTEMAARHRDGSYRRC
jgi:hypothetical protein